jgi:LPPG:FO 2-phospho-L-lactate transferase
MKIVAIAGGVGAAKFLRGLTRVVDARDVTVIGNVGDNIWVFGVYVAPDLDIVTYALAGVWDDERGWGIKGERFSVRDSLRAFGVKEAEWFALGDQDFATCLFRTLLLKKGEKLSSITDKIRKKFGVRSRIIPVTEQELTTMVRLDNGWVSFEEYYVRLRSEPLIHEIEYKGWESSEPAEGVISAIREADRVFICPSNPLASIAPILVVPGVREELKAIRHKVVAVSPLVKGKAIKGPADRMMAQLGLEPSPKGLASFYKDIAGTLVVDELDRESVVSSGINEPRIVFSDTLMVNENAAERLARQALYL